MKSCLFLISLIFLVNCSPEPSLRTLSSYVNPIDRVRIAVVNEALGKLPLREYVSLEEMVANMRQQVSFYALGPPEIVFMVYRWIGNNIYFDCYNYAHNPNYAPYLVYDVFGGVAHLGNIDTIGIRSNKYSTISGLIKCFDAKLDLRDKEFSMVDMDDERSNKKINLNDNNSVLSKVFGYFFDN